MSSVATTEQTSSCDLVEVQNKAKRFVDPYLTSGVLLYQLNVENED